MINAEIREIVTQELTESEALLWAGRPQKFPISFMSAYILGFSILWCVLLIFVLGPEFFDPDSSLLSGGFPFNIIPYFFVIAGIAMLIFAAMLFFAPSKQIYALTDKRGIVIDRLYRKTVRSISLSELAQATRKGSDRNGTIIFRKGRRASIFSLSELQDLAFHNIPNPRKIEEIIFNQIAKDK